MSNEPNEPNDTHVVDQFKISGGPGSHNVTLELNGEKLSFVTSCTVKVTPDSSFPKVTIEMYADVEVDTPALVTLEEHSKRECKCTCAKQ